MNTVLMSLGMPVERMERMNKVNTPQEGTATTMVAAFEPSLLPGMLRYPELKGDGFMTHFGCRT
jgi:hypothetical protein